MSAAATHAPPVPRRRRWLRVAIGIGLVLLVVALALRFAAQPERLTPRLLDRLGSALGLEITSTGASSYTVRGTPTLVVSNVVAREAGAATPVLRARRVLLSLPWSTLRDPSGELALTRIELDGPVLDVPALQHWLASRPPQPSTRLPSLSRGLHVSQGRIDGDGWRIAALDIDVPDFHRDAPLRGQVAGRFADAGTRADFRLALAATRPANGAGVALAGTVALRRGEWRLPMRLRLSGPLRIEDGSAALQPARLALSGRYRSGDQDLPFALGAHGPLQQRDATWSWAPVSIALRGGGLVPDAAARGSLAVGKRLAVRLDGALPAWPDAWPALPPPIGSSTAALPFELIYLGRADLSQPMQLRLARDQARFDARFALFDVVAWSGRMASGSPLPPLSGTLVAPQLEIAGATLEGVSVSVQDEATAAVDLLRPDAASAPRRAPSRQP